MLSLPRDRVQSLIGERRPCAHTHTFPLELFASSGPFGSTRGSAEDPIQGFHLRGLGQNLGQDTASLREPEAWRSVSVRTWDLNAERGSQLRYVCRACGMVLSRGIASRFQKSFSYSKGSTT